MTKQQFLDTKFARILTNIANDNGIVTIGSWKTNCFIEYTFFFAIWTHSILVSYIVNPYLGFLKDSVFAK